MTAPLTPELRARAEQHLKLTANCSGFQDDLTHQRRCKMCAGNYADHLIRDLLAAVEQGQPAQEQLADAHRQWANDVVRYKLKLEATETQLQALQQENEAVSAQCASAERELNDAYNAFQALQDRVRRLEGELEAAEQHLKIKDAALQQVGQRLAALTQPGAAQKE